MAFNQIWNGAESSDIAVSRCQMIEETPHYCTVIGLWTPTPGECRLQRRTLADICLHLSLCQFTQFVVRLRRCRMTNCCFAANRHVLTLPVSACQAVCPIPHQGTRKGGKLLFLDLCPFQGSVRFLLLRNDYCWFLRFNILYSIF